MSATDHHGTTDPPPPPAPGGPPAPTPHAGPPGDGDGALAAPGASASSGGPSQAVIVGGAALLAVAGVGVGMALAGGSDDEPPAAAVATDEEADVDAEPTDEGRQAPTTDDTDDAAPDAGEPSDDAMADAKPDDEPAAEASEPATTDDEPGTDTGAEFEPILLEGDGSQVVDLQVPGDVPAIARLRHDGEDRFAIVAYSEEGDEDYVLTRRGVYEGVRPLNFFDPVVELEVSASGAWSIEVLPLSQAPSITDGAAEGTTDAVYLLAASENTGRAEVTHEGERAITVYVYSDDFPDLMVNEVGPYQGESRVEDGSAVVTVQAESAWTWQAS